MYACTHININLGGRLDSKTYINFYISIFIRPTSGTAVTLKTGRREVIGSNPGRACRSSRSEFSVVFSETP